MATQFTCIDLETNMRVIRVFIGPSHISINMSGGLLLQGNFVEIRFYYEALDVMVCYTTSLELGLYRVLKYRLEYVLLVISR
jgi:hypothetical protein